MGKRKVYISYDFENERHYKNLLLAWNAQFDFLVGDYSPGLLSSKNDGQIKAALSDKIKQASAFLVIIGKNTYRNNWVKWEINKALELNIPIVAVKTERNNKTPDELYGIGANWAMAFTFDSIAGAINKS